MSIHLDIECSGLASLGRRLSARVAKAQSLRTEQCKAAADEFTPVRTGRLRDNFSYLEESSDGIASRVGWVYHEPYALGLWEGVTNNGTPAHTHAGPESRGRGRWTEHGAALRKDEILEKVRKELEE